MQRGPSNAISDIKVVGSKLNPMQELLTKLRAECNLAIQEILISHWSGPGNQVIMDIMVSITIRSKSIHQLRRRISMGLLHHELIIVYAILLVIDVQYHNIISLAIFYHHYLFEMFRRAPLGIFISQPLTPNP